MENTTLTALDGIRVGHAETNTGLSGCTVILLDQGAPAGVDIRGGAPGTYGTEGLNPIHLVDRVHAVFLTGGSAFGLTVGDGVRRYLKSRNVGFQTEYGVVPIVCGAVIFDLGINQHGDPPDADLGIRACEAATTAPVEEGCVGAGCGATVGKLLGLDHAMKGGLGSCCMRNPSGLLVGSLVVVNPFGDVVDRRSGRILAGCRTAPESRDFLDSQQALEDRLRLRGFSSGQNTVLGVVAINAALNKTELTKVAQMAHDGLARSIVPCHTQVDGDTVFALSCGHLQGVDVSIVGSLAAQCLETAVVRAVWAATSRGGLPAARDLCPPDQARDRSGS
ncbi:L-aminopeptidase/D-esterase [Desulfacinum hydrothermale DSM 13146]|uniref:L-aminopeptidase/D-esterase n=1 Tax=Desulfacinum hydrothermale DSM 13146 TaxID=1121390 RepID=A0A1W1XFQ6_9BACT|nr:P1 family peptidase [Desulfacinum hydrothermale]SMC22806.1 L-aminopeptidase/D-esterase [Desulfacinum hydrothermale DSM 13146]